MILRKPQIKGKHFYKKLPAYFANGKVRAFIMSVPYNLALNSSSVFVKVFKIVDMVVTKNKDNKKKYKLQGKFKPERKKHENILKMSFVGYINHIIGYQMFRIIVMFCRYCISCIFFFNMFTYISQLSRLYKQYKPLTK